MPNTKLKEEKSLKNDPENWIVKDPSISGEPLLIIGRQVVISDTKEKLDLLALDLIREWRLHKRCGPKIREMLLTPDKPIQQNFDVVSEAQ